MRNLRDFYEAGDLVGIITNRDMQFEVDDSRPVSEVMTVAPLITAAEGVSAEAALGLLRRHKIEKLPIVDGNGKLTGLITVKDFDKRTGMLTIPKDKAGAGRTIADCLGEYLKRPDRNDERLLDYAEELDCKLVVPVPVLYMHAGQH